MSIKDLFDKPEKVLNESANEILSEVESKDFIAEKSIEDNTFIPDVDFSDPKNFARFGLAEEYYRQTIGYIQNTYPYDGSEKETLQWKKNLTYLEKYFLDQEYPKATGYINLNSNSYTDGTITALTSSGLVIASSSIGQYVKTFSGPNAYGNEYTQGNIYNVPQTRSANLDIDPANGNTVELWLKLKSGLADNILSCSYGIFDNWNLVTDETSNTYSRFLIDFNFVSSSFTVTYKIGTQGVNRCQIPVPNADFYNWHHYAFVVKNDSSNLKIEFFKDGQFVSSNNTGSAITNTVYNKNLLGHLGAYCYRPVEGDATFASVRDYGQFPGAIDEFRYWKVDRGQRDIYRYRADRVYGGTNTDLYNTDLGVYYRFNEGIFSSNVIDTRDSFVLDYSGRVSNGSVINYRLNTRSTASAADESGLFQFTEPKDPILYSLNSSVIDFTNRMLLSGSTWDEQNTTSIFRSLPEWITEEDETVGTGQLKALTQIISSYFDKLYLEINSIPNFSFAEYSLEERKPAPFMNTILESNGLSVSDLFLHSKIIEDLKDRDDDRLFEEKLFDLKNLIYKNIYNNLTYIYKSKGTEKSFRNLIRSFGVDDELVKINLYANNTTFTLDDNKRDTVVRKKVVNLSTADTYDSAIINTEDSQGASYGLSYVPPTLYGSTAVVPYGIVPLTFETEIYFPKKPDVFDKNYSRPLEYNISLFGGYAVNNTASLDYTIDSAANKFGFEVFLSKNNPDDRGGYFKFVSLLTNETITSSYYQDLYDNEKWNFAVRLVPPFGNIDIVAENTGAYAALPATGSYRLELYGVNTIEDNVKNEFILSSSALTLAQVNNSHLNAKRFYVGAKKTNLTGSLINYTDIFVSNAKFWFDYISDTEIKEHSKDSLNYGRRKIKQKPYDTLGVNIDRSDLLGFYWDFDEITKADSNGEAYVKDNKGSKNNGSVFGSTVNKRYPAKIFNTVANNEDIVKKQYNLFSRQQLPENLFSSNTINVFGESDYYFTLDSRPINFFWSFEKSMYQTLSEDILNMFAGVVEFNNLIGDPLNRYKVINRDLQHLKTVFFQKLSNTPSLERYVEYYKWIDESLGFMLAQMVPAGVDSSGGIRNIVESHALEASSINLMPSILKKEETDYAQIKGIKELKYNWRKGHAPEDFSTLDTAATQASSSVWLKQRAERTSNFFVNSSATQAQQKQSILDNINKETAKKTYKLVNSGSSGSGLYTRTSFADRKLARVVDIESKKVTVVSDTIDIYDVKNIADVTSSVELRPIYSGSDAVRNSIYNKPKTNYYKKYSYIGLGGRDINNKYFVDITGSEQVSSNSVYVSGAADRPLDDRNIYKNIFVDRFSPIGGAEVSGRGVLDRASETYSPYSSLNNRNIVQRKYFNKWMAQTSSFSASSPSLHKVHKNHLRLGDKDQYDNNFIIRQIPRSDYNYRFFADAVTASVTSSGQFSSIYPNISLDSVAFLSASLEDGVVYDFVGLNTNFALTASIQNSQISSNGPLHIFLMKENGPFGYSNLHAHRKQYNPIVKYHRKNNIFAFQSTFDEPIVRTTGVNNWVDTFFKPIRQTARKFGTNIVREPAVEWNLPVYEKIKVVIEPINSQNTTEKLDMVEAKTDLSNEIDYYANSLLSDKLSLFAKNDTDTGYRKLFNLYGIKNDTIQDINLDFITRKEIIFPKKQFIGLNEIRTLPNYAEEKGFGSNGYDRNIANVRTFWKDSITDRLRTSAVDSANQTGSINSLNYANTSASLSQDYTFNMYFMQVSESALLKTNLVTRIFKPYTNKSSLFTMDNSSSISFENDIRPDDDYIHEGNILETNEIKGELSPLSEFEIKRFITQPSGTYSAATRQRSTKLRRQPFAQKFVYGDTFFRPAPRPQYLFINHKNWYYERRVGINILGGLFDFSVKVAFINEGMKYYSDILSGKKPWFNSYEDYASDVRSIGQNYSVVPEYKISNDINYFYIDNAGDFSKPKQDYLSLDGITDFNDADNKIVNDFRLNKYFSSDSIKTNVYNENKSLIQDSANLLNIKIKGVKKLLPYKGFYPQDRSVQVVKQFSDSFLSLDTNNLLALSASVVGAYTGSTGCPIDQQVISLMQPLFSPGILYNTIKASVAVDWPTFLTQSTTGSYINMPNFYSTASTTAFSSSNLSYTIDKDFNYRFPFEAILDINSAIPQDKKTENVGNKTTHNILYYLNPTYYSSDFFRTSYYSNISGTIAVTSSESPRFPFYQTNYIFSNLNKTWQEKNDLYRLSINNYLSEIVDFFLLNGSLTTFNSKKQSEINEQVNPSKTYFMDICLYRGSEQKQILDQEYSVKLSSGFLIFQNDFQDYVRESGFYGPPSRFWYNKDLGGTYISSSATSYRSIYKSSFDSDLQDEISFGPLYKTSDPAYAPYTPPYYYGKARARIKYKPKYEQIVSLQEILDNSTIEYINDEATEVFNDAEDTDFTQSPAYKCMMTLSSSLNIKQLKNLGDITYDARTGQAQQTTTTTTNDKIWSIQTKFETPLLNFNNSYNNSISPIKTTNTSEGVTVYQQSTVGLWSGYGTLPTGSDEGIYLSIEESFTNPNADTGSLRTLLGFDRINPEQIGKIAPSKTISEAIVLIPYTKNINTDPNSEFAVTADPIPYENNDERYFTIDQTALFARALATVSGQNTEVLNTQLGKTIELMDKYVLPPHLDWKKNPNKVKPFVMFIAEFQHDLDAQDLADIWQGLMPKIATTAEKSDISLSINLNNKNDFFHGKQLPPDVKFKIFKVKKKAKINYYNLTSDSGDNEKKFQFKFGAETFNDVKYSYNWPYDFFSLVDRIQVEADLSVGTTPPDVAPFIRTDINLIPRNVNPAAGIVAATQTSQQPTQAQNSGIITFVPTIVATVAQPQQSATQQGQTTQPSTVAPGLGTGINTGGGSNTSGGRFPWVFLTKKKTF